MGLFDKLLGRGAKSSQGQAGGPFLSDDPRELAETSLMCHPEFAEAIRVLSEDPTEANKRVALDELLKLNIWIAMEKPVGPVSDEGTASISLVCVTLPDGTHAATGFTDPFAAKLFMDDDFSLLNIGLSGIAEAMEGHPVTDIVINYGGPAGIHLNAEEIPFLIRGENPYALS